MRRIFYFLLTNLAVVIVLGTVMRLIGVEPYLTQQGLNYESLLIFAALFGMGGSFISLALSKWAAKRLTGATSITTPQNETEGWIVQVVSDLARSAGIDTPEIAVYPSKDSNAFATGMRKNKALVAVSSGLLQHMNRSQVEAVLAHEIRHIANGDMVTLALIQGVVNTFVIFFARIIGNLVDRIVFKNEGKHGIAFWVTTIVAEICLALLASIIVFWFSRKREYHADKGAALMVGKRPMIGALESLKKSVTQPHLPDEMAAFGISGSKKGGLASLFATHPNLDDRIDALEASSCPEYGA